MATLFIDYENGNDNWGGTSFAVLASGTDGRISSNTFSAATANFSNNGTLAPTKNLIGAAESLDNLGGWTGNNITTSLSNISPPSGLSTVWNILETSTNGSHNIANIATSMIFANGSSYTLSVYVRSNGRNQFTLQFTSDSTRAARFDMTGSGSVVQTGANATATITSVGNSWYRATLTATSTATSHQFFIGLTNDTHTGVSLQTYAGDTARGIYVSSPQIEASATATSYEKPPEQYISIFNGSSYINYLVAQYINSTSLLIITTAGGTALGNQTVDRQYFIGGRWQTITTGLSAVRTNPGDIIRVMASPDPTLVGNATFTSNKADVTRNISSSTNTTPIAITTTSTHEYITGDTVVITGHTTNTNANGTWTITVTGTNTFTLDGSTGNGVGGTVGTVRRITNGVIRLSSSVTANIASFGNRGDGRTAWTPVAGGNASASLDLTDTKEGEASDSISVTAAFVTGKVAYKTTGTLNLSGYQQVSFWIKQTAGTTTVNGDISLRLCSDTTGDTTVNTINIPAIVANSRWIPFTVDLGTNLGSNIQSVALYVDTDRGAQTFLISNIIACKARSSADSLNLQSLVGKNTASEKWWGCIQSINNTRVILDQDPSSYSPTSAANNTGGINVTYRGYNGTSETTSLFKRETIKTAIASTSATTNNIQSYTADSGLSNSTLVDLQFGFDRTNMSSRTGETFFDGLNGWGVGLSIISRNYLKLSNIGFCRYLRGLYFQGTIGSIINNVWLCGHTEIPMYLYTLRISDISNIYTTFNRSEGMRLDVTSQRNTLSNIFSSSNGSRGIYYGYSSNNLLINSISNNNALTGYGMGHGIRNIIKNCSFINNHNAGIDIADSADNNLFVQCTTTNNSHSITCFGTGNIYVKNCILNETSEAANFTPYSDGRTIFINNDNSNNNYIIYTDNGTIYNTVAIRYSNRGFAWAMAPTSNVDRNSAYPLALSIAKVAVNANNLVIVRAWMRRTNILLTTGLRVKGEQIAGVPNDITSYMTAAADTWEQVTLSFTPSEAGVVEILAECWGGTTFTAYVDDISITQV